MSREEERNQNYISKHLAHELRLLLSAYELWEFLRESKSGFMVNIARDSICIHFRSLLTFFCTSPNGNDCTISDFITPVGDKPFYDSDYKKWLGVINEALLHISPKRYNTNNAKLGDLNEQMKQFRDEILRLWNLFIKDSKIYRKSLKVSLKNAKEFSRKDLETYKKSLSLI